MSIMDAKKQSQFIDSHKGIGGINSKAKKVSKKKKAKPTTPN